VAPQAAIQCIEMIHDEKIVGRHAIYCISEMRVYTVALVQRNLSKHIMDYDHVCDVLMNLSNSVLRPLQSNSAASSSCALISDLLPTCIIGLHRLHANMLKSSPDIINYSSNIIDIMLSNAERRSAIMLASLNCLVECYSCLSSDQVRSLQVRILKR
jgi:hypothetical protein